MKEGLRIHDAELIEVKLDRANHNIEMVFERVNDSRFLVKFVDTYYFRITDMIWQNVVYDLYWSDYHAMSREQIVSHVKWASSMSDSGSWMKADAMEMLVEDILARKQILCYLMPSWGAEAVVIAKQVSFQELE